MQLRCLFWAYLCRRRTTKQPLKRQGAVLPEASPVAEIVSGRSYSQPSAVFCSKMLHWKHSYLSGVHGVLPLFVPGQRKKKALTFLNMEWSLTLQLCKQQPWGPLLFLLYHSWTITGHSRQNPKLIRRKKRKKRELKKVKCKVSAFLAFRYKCSKKDANRNDHGCLLPLFYW